ncbi:hypothetical protein Riv7116_2620 [Rivularia sp. PCC 7116]|nr:hypothetical protein Riv7116_2620 [Rivularia sp. PCC 7116]
MDTKIALTLEGWGYKNKACLRRLYNNIYPTYVGFYFSLNYIFLAAESAVA